jgi:hypothetical protein
VDEQAPDALERVAAAVADGESIDWQHLVESGVLTQDQVRSFRVLELLRRGGQEVAATLPLETGFTILGELGRGSHGRVYLAVDRALGREVALKVLDGPRSAAARERFVREARMLAGLDHPNIVRVHSIDEQAGRLRISLERIDGRTLENLVRSDGPFSAEEAARIGIELCRALSALHAKGLVHRDLKPANVMRAVGGRIVLLDFGLARSEEPGERDGEVLAGTPHVMAPEQLEGRDIDARTDLYALGVTLYWLVTGQYPFRATSLAELRERVLAGTATPISDHRANVPPRFAEIVTQLISVDPKNRPVSAGLVEQALRQLLAGAEATRAPRAPSPDDSAVDFSGTHVKTGASRGVRRAVQVAAGVGVLGLLVLVVSHRTGETMSVTMEQVYLACAAVGGTILVVQTLLLMFAGHGDLDGHVDGADMHDVSGHDHVGDGHGDLFVKLLTFKTVVAFLTFFGLAGLASGSAGFDRGPSLLMAIAAGCCALFAVGYLMSALSRLQSRGNLNVKNAVGRPARVYLRIPANRQGHGKIMVTFQGRTVECRAMTPGAEIPTGAQVKVIAATGVDMLEVQSLEKE